MSAGRCIPRAVFPLRPRATAARNFPTPPPPPPSQQTRRIVTAPPVPVRRHGRRSVSATASGIRTQQRAQSSSSALPVPAFPTAEHPGRTALYELHVEHGATMVPFGGYTMPLQYSDQTIGASHAWTRTHASLFDVGHMAQWHVTGPGAEAFLETVTPAGLRELAPNQATLSALLHSPSGGIVDDCMITRLAPAPDGDGSNHHFYLVTNAGCRSKDYTFLAAALAATESARPPARLRHLQTDDGRPFGLLALQGPEASAILRAALSTRCTVDLDAWYFGSTREITFGLRSKPGSEEEESLPVLASRGGYTGEDGFELSVHPTQTEAVARLLLAVAGPDSLRLAGLAARDSLRLEAGMCLYGQDLDDSTTPGEAGLGWIVARARRSGERAQFNGAAAVLPQLTPVAKGGAGLTRRRVGLVVEGAPARPGAPVLASDGSPIGTVTSGCPSPTLKQNIAMAYVADGSHAAGTRLLVDVRGKKRAATVVKLPFVPAKYAKQPAGTSKTGKQGVKS